MKNIKISVATIFLFIMYSICNKVNAQYREMVPNGGFEYGGTLSCGYSSVSDYNIANWAPALGAFVWWDWNQYSANPACEQNTLVSDYNIENLPPPISPRCIMLYPQVNGSQGECMCDNSINGGTCNTAACSGLNYPLRSIGQGAVYKLSFIAAWSNMISSLGPCSPEVKIHFVPGPKSVDYSDNCISKIYWQTATPNIELDYALNWNSGAAGQWQPFEEYFEVPEGWDNQLTNIVVEGYNACGDCVIFVDNVSVEEFNYCDCTEESGSAQIDNSTNPIPNACIQGGDPWDVNIDNATSISLFIYDKWDNLVYNISCWDAGILNTAGYPFYQVWWDGDDNQGNMVQVDTYDYVLTIGNCHGNSTYSGDINVLGGSGPAQYMTQVNNNSIPDCCPQDDDIEGVDFGGNFRADVSDAITIGQTSIVSMDAGCNAQFYAGNTINVGPNVVIQPGAGYVHLLTQFCTNVFALEDHHPVKNNNSRFHPIRDTIGLDSSYTINVYPNPSHGIFHIGFPIKDFNVDMELKVSDILGNVIYSSNVNSSNATLNLSGKSSGVYILKVIIGTEQYEKKLVLL